MCLIDGGLSRSRHDALDDCSLQSRMNESLKEKQDLFITQGGCLR